MKLENGIHDISNEAYHSSAGLSRSALWKFKRSPWHYWNKYLNPNAPDQTVSPQMKLGEVVHALVLEPNTFHQRYAYEPTHMALPKVELLRDVGREEYERQKIARETVIANNQLTMTNFLLEAQGKEIISADIYNEGLEMASSLLSNQTARDLFKDVKVEKSIYFNHKSTSLQCKIRPDAWTGTIVTDLKTTKDASYRVFQNAAFSSGYFLQAAMIKTGLASIGIDLEKFVFYCIEKTTGYPCVYYILDEEALDYGMNQFNTLMEQFARCLELDKWDGYEPQILYVPKYATPEKS